MDGVIKLEIPNVSTFEFTESPSHMIANLPWCLKVTTECSERTQNIKCIGIYLSCHPKSESTMWSCEAHWSFSLLSRQDGTTPLQDQSSNKFSFNDNGWGYIDFIKWDDFEKPENGYVRDDKAIIEASIVVCNVRGIRLTPVFDFKEPQGRASDGVLVIENTRLHIDKDILAVHSRVFAALFYGKFRERELEEIPLKGVKVEQFTELLRVVYPSQKPVDVDNVEFLLMLGDMFEIKLVVDACEKFLIGTETFDVITKLVWAGQYQLVALHDVCMSTLKTVPDIKKLKEMKQYNDLSDAIKMSLLEKMFKLT